MICAIGDNILSSLGFDTQQNYAAVRDGRVGMRLYENALGVPEPFMGALIDRELLESSFEVLNSNSDSRFYASGHSKHPDWSSTRYTHLEKAAILSAADAIARAGIDPAAGDVLFVFSSTKGNVHLLESEGHGFEPQRVKLWRSAQLIASYFGNTNTPITVSNACISGASALLAGAAELRAGRYKYAVVVGADMLSKFIISGFQSFKALSITPCRPFDARRDGLNLGEAAATIVLACREDSHEDVALVAGAVRNDANHISGPSRTGEGAYLALTRTLEGVDPAQIAFVSAHGTATGYNDEMESIAITRAGLANVPVNSLKGGFGHTLGAAGVLESIISMRSLTDGIALATANYGELGVSHPIHVTTENIASPKSGFIKMLSGFGGCNAALLFTKGRVGR